jgi:aspartyl-tRNA(Asn)/glutamyl-tRNA(Gln) amidotransferase subunit B
MLTVRDEGALDAWCEQVIRENPKVADDVRAGKVAAVGRLVGGVMKLSGGAADAAGVKTRLMRMLGAGSTQ